MRIVLTVAGAWVLVDAVIVGVLWRLSRAGGA
jgi:hypothetical protein